MGEPCQVVLNMKGYRHNRPAMYIQHTWRFFTWEKLHMFDGVFGMYLLGLFIKCVYLAGGEKIHGENLYMWIFVCYLYL